MVIFSSGDRLIFNYFVAEGIFWDEMFYTVFKCLPQIRYRVEEFQAHNIDNQNKLALKG